MRDNSAIQKTVASHFQSAAPFCVFCVTFALITGIGSGRAMATSRKVLTLFDDYHDMMSDPVRTLAYVDAINEAVSPGDLVVDLGAGLGILGFLALRAGARKVIAIEKGDAIELARRVAAENGLSEKIEFVAANSKNYVPTERADVIVSETLGSFGVEENTLDFTIDARERLLKPGGRLVPQRLAMVLAPVTHPEGAQKADFWSDVAGFDFSPAREEALSRMAVFAFEEDQILAEPGLFADVDLHTVQSPHLENILLFKMQAPGTLHGLAGWFEAALFGGIGISTAPFEAPTHWKQAFFPFRQAVEVVEGDVLEVTMKVRPESWHSDSSQVTYDFRCTQIASG
jgi:protein arginine N-methyltransferase 1